MKNRSLTLLALLAANGSLGDAAVQRTTLVKQAFLAETIRPLYSLWLRTFSFIRYLYGPYSDDLFQHLDTLIFSGLAKVEALSHRGGGIEARYRITDAGLRILQRFEHFGVVNLAKDLVWALQSLGIDHASAICKLVYQEAEFSKIFTLHAQTNVGPHAKFPIPAITDAGNETFLVLATLQELIEQPSATIVEGNHEVPTREVVRLFLLSLANQTVVPR